MVGGHKETLEGRSMLRLGEIVEEPAAAIVQHHHHQIVITLGEESVGVVEQRQVSGQRHGRPAQGRHPQGGGDEPIDPRSSPVGQHGTGPAEVGIHLANRQLGGHHQGIPGNLIE
jgi:hypothetical protein